MLAQILVAILIVTVAVMVGVDLVRTSTEDPLGQPDGAGYKIRPTTIGGTRGDRTGASYGTGIPAAGQDAGEAGILDTRIDPPRTSSPRAPPRPLAKACPPSETGSPPQTAAGMSGPGCN